MLPISLKGMKNWRRGRKSENDLLTEANEPTATKPLLAEGKYFFSLNTSARLTNCYFLASRRAYIVLTTAITQSQNSGKNWSAVNIFSDDTSQVGNSELSNFAKNRVIKGNNFARGCRANEVESVNSMRSRAENRSLVERC